MTYDELITRIRSGDLGNEVQAEIDILEIHYMEAARLFREMQAKQIKAINDRDCLATTVITVEPGISEANRCQDCWKAPKEYGNPDHRCRQCQADHDYIFSQLLGNDDEA